MGVYCTTKEIILNAAEKLFAEKGYYATTIRGITHEAGVNNAAVNYHFRSKEHLYRIVIERRLNTLNEKRIRLLEELCADKDTVNLEDILRIAVEPLVEVANDPQKGGLRFLKLLGCLYMGRNEQDRELIQKQREELWVPFRKAIEEAVTDETTSEVWWRFRFMIGAVAHHLSCSDSLRGNAPNHSNRRFEVERIINCISVALIEVGGER